MTPLPHNEFPKLILMNINPHDKIGDLVTSVLDVR